MQVPIEDRKYTDYGPSVSDNDIDLRQAWADTIAVNRYYIEDVLELVEELDRRTMDALSLYTPLPFQERYHESTNPIVVMRKGNRVGGSLCGFAEDARAALERDPYGKYSSFGYKTMVCLGYGERHIANVIYKYLFQPGAFKIIRDLETMRWRVFHPWSNDDDELVRQYGPGDEGREDMAIPAPPFISPENIEGKPVWVNAGAKIFQEIRLKTGWRIIAANSNGDPRQLQGVAVSLLHIDEDIADPEWFVEQYMRLTDEGGYVRWTAMAHGENDILQSLYQQADEQEHLPDGHEEKMVECIQVSTLENPYIPKKSARQRERVLRALGDDIYRQRILGDATNESIYVYPDYSSQMHCIRHSNNNGPLQEAYRDNGWYPPEDWAVYTSTDPGHQVAATLGIAIPPPDDFGDVAIVYDEIYVKQATAILWSKKMEEHYRSRCIEDMIFDMHGGRLRNFNDAEMVHETYSRVLSERRIGSRKRGSKFRTGCDDIRLREDALRRQLSPLYHDGSGPRIYIDTHRCPNLVDELRKFKKKSSRGRAGVIISDEANRKLPCHAIECLEYFAAADTPYVKPESAAERRIKDIVKRYKGSGNKERQDGVVFGEISMTTSLFS